jgi:hypothetical protein
MDGYNTFHIVIDEESDWTETFVWQDELTGLPVPLTGYRAEIQVRTGSDGDTATALNNPRVVLTFTTDGENPPIVLGGTAGTIQVTIPYSATYQTYWNQAVYSLILVSPTGQRKEFLRGFFIIQPNASKLGTSTLENLATGTVESPNNQGAQAQDSNNPEVPDPTAGSAPPQYNYTMTEWIEYIVENLDY